MSAFISELGKALACYLRGRTPNLETWGIRRTRAAFVLATKRRPAHHRSGTYIRRFFGPVRMCPNIRQISAGGAAHHASRSCRLHRSNRGPGRALARLVRLDGTCHLNLCPQPLAERIPQRIGRQELDLAEFQFLNSEQLMLDGNGLAAPRGSKLRALVKRSRPRPGGPQETV